MTASLMQQMSLPGIGKHNLETVARSRGQHLGLVRRDGVLQRQHVQASALVGRVGPFPTRHSWLSREPYLADQSFVSGAEHGGGRFVVRLLDVAGSVPAACINQAFRTSLAESLLVCGGGPSLIDRTL